MAQGKDTTNLAGLLFRFMGMEDPMLGMLEWLCGQMMEAEVSSQLGAGKHEQNPDRVSHRCGFRPRRLDTRMGTMYLPVPKVRNGGYIPFFVTERRRSEGLWCRWCRKRSCRACPPGRWRSWPRAWALKCWKKASRMR